MRHTFVSLHTLLRRPVFVRVQALGCLQQKQLLRDSPDIQNKRITAYTGIINGLFADWLLKYSAIVLFPAWSRYAFHSHEKPQRKEFLVVLSLKKILIELSAERPFTIWTRI